MAFNKNNNVAEISNSDSKQDNWKSRAFINIFLPTEEGKRRKLGSIALKGQNGPEAELIAWLEEDPSRVTQLFANAEIDFRMAEAKPGTGFKLG